MKLSLCSIILSLLAISAVNSTNPDDTQCQCIFNNLWMEMVLLIDNSQLMQQAPLWEIGSTLNTVFGYSNVRIGTNYTDARSSRVAVITYNEDVEVVADLDSLNSKDELVQAVYRLQIADSGKSDLFKGLKAASDMLTKGKMNERRDFPQTIVVFASAFRQYGDEDINKLADELKQNGIKLIVISYVERNADDSIEKLAALASPGASFNNFDNGDIATEIRQAMCNANCYCPMGWTQFYYYNKFNQYKQYATCINVAGISQNWATARISCQTFDKKGYLATEYTMLKHDFNYNTSKSLNVEEYHIGLSFSDGNYFWEQPKGEKLIKLVDPIFGLPANPQATVAVLNAQATNSNTQWAIEDKFKKVANFICERPAYDTEHFLF